MFVIICMRLLSKESFWCHSYTILHRGKVIFFNGSHAQAFPVHSKLSIYTKSIIHVVESVVFIAVVVAAVIAAVAPIVVAVVVSVRRRCRCRY